MTALFRHALAAVRADRLAEHALQGVDFSHVIAIGKAAEALAAGAWRAGKDRIEAGFLALPHGYATGDLSAAAPFERHEGAHPVPDDGSLAAGAALLDFVDRLPRGERVVVLLSGGASASVECPAPDVDLEFLRRANRWLLASGLPIEAINRVRAGLSRIKGGGLALRLGHVQASAWALADAKELACIGGALLSPLTAGPMPALPRWLKERLGASPSGVGLPLQRLAGNEEAVAAVVAQGTRTMGELVGDATELGARIGGELAAARPGLYVWGGEATLRLPAAPGCGGRCQQLALAAALEIAGHDDCFLLSASTDGWDGTDAVAGACVDGGSLRRAAAAGFDATLSLRRADAGSLLAASGDLVRTGPTGTNVNDLVIALKCGTRDSGLGTRDSGIV